jgi:hypothetical protein
MKIDRYTKIILTIIAGCMLWGDFLRPIPNVPIVHAGKEIFDVNIEKVGGRSVFWNLPVEIVK